MSQEKRLRALYEAHRAMCSAPHLLKVANAPQTLKRVRASLRSLDGAIRNRERFARQGLPVAQWPTKGGGK